MSQHPTDNFDALRLTGALMVLVSHQFALAGRVEPNVVGENSFGGLGLAIFFSVSGYLVTMSWFNDPHVARFASRRLLRIWPALAVTVTSLAVAAWLLLGKGALALHFLTNLAFSFQDGNFFSANPHPELDGPIYTIPYEMLCYVGVCVLGLLFGRRVRWVFLVGAPVAVALIVLLTGSGALRQFLGTYRLFVVLAAYFVAGSIVFHFPALQRGRAALCALVAGALCLGLGKIPAATLIAIPISVIWVGRQSWPAVRRAGRFGDFSYGLYLWAWPVTQSGVVLLGRETPLPVLLAVTLVCTFALAALSWHLIEKPAMRLKPSARRTAAVRSGLAVERG